MLNRIYFHLEQRKILYQGKEDISPDIAKIMFSKLNTGYYTSQEEEFIMTLLLKKSFLHKRNGEYEFIKKNKNYKPNIISKNIRFFFLSIAIGLVFYGLFGINQGEIYLPTKRGHAVTFVGDSIYVLFGSFVALAIACIIIVADHYDKRNNEHLYDLVLKGLGYVSFVLFIAACIWNLAS
ncbi:TPA: hypothetical protein ACX6RJ_002068 [Photobacterium damselae]